MPRRDNFGPKNSRFSHGHAIHGEVSPEYNAWQCLIYRCTNPASPRFSYYGGRGVTVCERWRNSFDAFLEDMGPRPSPKHSLDRIDNNGNYEPGNVRWATREQQQNNTRKNRLLTHNGVTLSVSAWARRLGIGKGALFYRLNSGWSVEDALTVPIWEH